MKSLIDLSRVRRLLCIGAHSDDIEIGCGATVLRILRESPRVEVTWTVFCAAGERGLEAKAGAAAMLQSHGANVLLHGFRDAHLPAAWADVKAAFATVREACSEPDLILTHRRDDLHQDHRLLAEMTGQMYRNHGVLGYEIPKYDADLGRPNVYVAVGENDLSEKLGALEAFKSQRDKHWFDNETFRGLARIRGLECNSDSKYAEAFYCTKMSI